MQDDQQSVNVVLAALAAYNRWAQDGFAGGVPAGLVALSSEAARPGFESDAFWYARGQVRQRASMVVREARLVAATDDSAIVVADIDLSQTALTAEGEPVNFDQEQGGETTYRLIRDATTGQWLFDSHIAD
ncbi:MAG: hypothetical protein Q4G34_02710 [Micrococcus sp.]|nr:hypothetical protein [Micrococcus sp.]